MSLSVQSRTFGVLAAVVAALLLPAFSARAQVLDVTTTVTLGGTNRYDSIRVRSGGRIVVRPFNGSDRVNTGNLVLIAPSITVDAGGVIDGRGAGYQTALCGDGRAPAGTDGGGAGGCSVYDSGGGGGHFGGGGRGTKDCNILGSLTACDFPAEFEEDCGNTLNGAGTACGVGVGDCRGTTTAMYDGVPSVAGLAYRHSIYEVEFGASGGDKGCRDGFESPNVAGPGGGRLVLVALTDTGAGVLTINGQVSVNGRRGCGIGNDSGGGGAGGSMLLVGDEVLVGATAVVSAAGGLGGDTFSGTDATQCAGMQSTGTCDDCGGGGGGGIINVLSRRSTLNHSAAFDVGGADGGTCTICRGEAGGGAGELLLDGAYVGELCDGFDNDFDGTVDEDLGTFGCGLGACRQTLDTCTSDAPTACSPMVTSDASCRSSDAGAQPRIAVILDTSSSMLLDLNGFPTFGDGTVDRPGLDTNGNGRPDDSRLHLARESLANVISAYPEIDFALARYHQDQGLNRSCQTAKWFECEGLIGTYDNPTNNTGDLECTVRIRAGSGAGTTVQVREQSGGDECINYAGTCGSPRRGADVLSGFGTPTRDLVRWLDGRETGFDPDTTVGDVCRHARGGRDCEVRASGETPLTGSLQAVEDYMVPIRATDPSAGCRDYSIILVTDGVESCGGSPNAQAQHLWDAYGIETRVIAVSVLANERAALNALARAGSNGLRDATFVSNPADLVPALTSILQGSIRTERCNAMDDDCDGRVDEGFAIGVACDDGGVGACRGTGETVCADSELAVECEITMAGATPGTESCNAADDDCDEAIDESLTCTGLCTPTGAEICNAIDDDCDGLVDESDPTLPSTCGEDAGECGLGANRCVAGTIQCIGGTGPRDEVCNGLDDDCDGEADDLAECPGTSLCTEGACRRACDPTAEFPCPVGYECQMPEGETRSFCLPTACAACAVGERCIDDVCVDPCEGVTCDTGLTCRGGDCIGCEVLGCGENELCLGRLCAPDRCEDTECENDEACDDGDCRPACQDASCTTGTRCVANGSCAVDACADVECGTGQACVDGDCVADPCRTPGGCELGEVCVAGVGCGADPCLVVRCPSGRTCGVSSTGVAECRGGAVGFDAGPSDETPWVTAKGGGCSASPGSRGTSAWMVSALSVLVIVVARRRRREVA